MQTGKRYIAFGIGRIDYSHDNKRKSFIYSIHGAL